MATLTIWRADIDRALATSPKVYVREAPEIHFVEPETGLNLARANLSWDEVDELIRQLTAIKPAEKPAKTLKELVGELEKAKSHLRELEDEQRKELIEGTIAIIREVAAAQKQISRAESSAKTGTQKLQSEIAAMMEHVFRNLATQSYEAGRKEQWELFNVIGDEFHKLVIEEENLRIWDTRCPCCGQSRPKE